MDYTSFIIGIIGSLIASVIFTMAAYLISKRFKKQVTILFNRVVDTGMIYIYNNQKEAIDDIKRSFKSSDEIRIMAYRGYSYYTDTGSLRFILKDLEKWQRLYFMSSDPISDGKVNYIIDRASEVTNIDTEEQQHYVDEVKHGVKILASIAAKNDNIEISHHNHPPTFKIMLFRDDLYLSYLSKDSRAKNNKMYRYRSGSDMYKVMERHFDLVLKGSRKSE